MDQPYTVEQYETNNPIFLDVDRFRFQPKTDYISVRDVTSVYRLTSKGGWTKRWNNWGVRGVLSATVPRKALDMKFVRV